jgi:N-acetylmuramoyl-L-alanine amidase
MKVARVVLVGAALWLAGVALAGAATVQNVRLWDAPDHSRLVFDLSQPREHRVLVLQSPPRVVIDLERSRLEGALPAVEPGSPFVAALRAAQFDADTLRIVLDLKKETNPRTFALPPAGPYGHRLVVDLYGADADGARDVDNSAATARRNGSRAETRAPREIVIAIDAGHGGEDPGAIGRRYRTREKDVTLAVARELARLVAATPGMRPVLTRDGDYYVGLAQRYRKAEAHRADVFVSIHADAVPGRQANGSSVYALSERGASSVLAKLLSDRENLADLIGGVDVNVRDDYLHKTMADLYQTKTVEYSLQMGQDVLSELRLVGPIHLSKVNQAAFMVLKSPKIPSVLVETAFISNPTEEKKLRTRDFQQALARGIFAGIKRYLARSAPLTPTVVASAANDRGTANPNEHVVRPGETLAAIARQHNIHIEALRFLNNLGEKDPPVGARLRLLGSDT